MISYTEGTQSVTVATQQYAAFLVEGILEVQANQDLIDRYSKKIGYALARGRDVTLANLFANFSTNVVGSYGVELTKDDFDTVWTDLAQAGLFEDSNDPGDDFCLFMSPAAYAAATKIDVIGNRMYNTQADVIQKMQTGDINGLPVLTSNLLYSPAATQHAMAAIHRDAIALILQEEIPMQSQYLIRYLADGVVGWDVYGSSIISFPPETPGGGSTVDNRGVLLKGL